MTLEWWQNLKAAERIRYSQCGEEGVIEEIFRHVVPVDRVLVDIGANDHYSYSNTRLLIDAGWTGHMFDVVPFKGVHAERFTAENTCELLSKYGVPKTFELLSLDIDGIDWHVLKALLEGGYRPWVIVCEINCNVPADPPVTVANDPAFVFDGSLYHGASLGAYRDLGAAHGYLLVHQCGLLNAVMVRRDLLPEGAEAGDLGFFQFAAHSGDPLKREWVEAIP
jgi:hypothetical protein